jgi:hypothetical protein
MKIISPQECNQWVRAKLGQDFALETFAPNFPHCVTYQLPVDTGKKSALARFLAGSVDTSTPGLFWITGWGIFPSSENMALFEGYRVFLGESRALDTAPGHINDESDLLKLECLLDLALYFYWDALLFDEVGSIAVRTSHDERLSIYGKSPERLNKLESDLGRLGLSQSNLVY